ncbi:MAG: DUF4184 family protein, partial [Proteobacteria bacterium]|nr:DUF4184 family protein [Pseudomonadota bacterium]
HVAAVLPARRWLRRGGLFSAAVVGSMVPDFGLLLPFPLDRGATHSAHALLSFCLPVGLLSWLLYEALIRPAWAEVLPGGWRLRPHGADAAVRYGDWRAWAGVCAALLFGAVTHLCWDAFTHEGARGVQMLPFLDDVYGPDLVGHPLRLYRWLQHGSSVVGLLIVMIAAWRWAHDGRTLPPPAAAGSRAPGAVLGATERLRWLLAYAAVPVLVLAASMLMGRRHHHGWYTLGDVLTHLAKVGLGGTAISLLLVSALIRARIADAASPPLDG